MEFPKFANRLLDRHNEREWRQRTLMIDSDSEIVYNKN
jgi:hypothetical protein